MCWSYLLPARPENHCVPLETSHGEQDECAGVSSWRVSKGTGASWIIWERSVCCAVCVCLSECVFLSVWAVFKCCVCSHMYMLFSFIPLQQGWSMHQGGHVWMQWGGDDQTLASAWWVQWSSWWQRGDHQEEAGDLQRTDTPCHPALLQARQSGQGRWMYSRWGHCCIGYSLY